MSFFPKVHRFFTTIIRCLLTCVVVGCGKKEETAPALPKPADASPAGGETAATPSQQDVVIAERSIEYIKGRLDQKDNQAARDALAQLEPKPMTPAQRQRVAALKAQLPKN